MLLDGYIRVSQVGDREGESFISPVVQQEQIEGWITRSGAMVGEIFIELDESGARKDRPLLAEAIRRVESQESDGVVVAKLDRFGRSVVDGLSAIARIQKAGGSFASVQDGFDITTATGKLVLQILFSIGEWELERVRSNWATARQRAISRGLFLSGFVPFGYARRKDGRLRIDRKAARFVREAFERRARGETLEEIAEFFNESGLRRPHAGNAYDRVAIGNLLLKRTYLGESRSGDYVNTEAHEPIVDHALWQLCRRPKPKPRHGAEGLLRGRLRCAACGALMTPHRSTPKNRVPHSYYRCHARARGCPAPAVVRASDIEPLIEEFIFRKPTRRFEAQRVPMRAHEVLLERVERDLAEYRDSPGLLRQLGHARFEAGLEPRRERVDRALADLGELRRAQMGPRFDTHELEDHWSEMTWSERHAALREFIDFVVIERGRKPVVDRAWIYKRGQGHRLPRPKGEPGPLSSSKRSTRLKQPAIWPEGRIESELRDFLSGLQDWPEFLYFARAGRARLCAQAWRWGGPYYWAPKLNLGVPAGTVRWSDELVECALRPLMRGRSEWPTRQEFIAAGFEAVHHAMLNHGGQVHWADQFGLQFTPRQKVAWTEERIERHLSSFTAQRRRFPTRTEFLSAGESRLYSAVCRRGGLDYWGDRIGLPLCAGSRDCED